MKIFFGDLVHTWNKVSVWTVPLNIAFVASYARQHVQGAENIEFRLFKNPERMIEAIQNEKPDVVGLSHYVWNTRLNAFVYDVAKQANPSVLCVGGGPNITNLTANEEGGHRFFALQPHCDAYVYNQGEQGFAALLRRFLELDGDTAALVAGDPPDGCLVNRSVTGEVLVGTAIDPIMDLDQIPSPYLSGMLDEFLAQPLIPMLETNRSCPYRCTFCAWGISASKLAKFSDARVSAEIDYIARHNEGTANLFVTDANFGILERDQVFAQQLYAAHDQYGYPGRVALQWNKTRPDRVLKAAKEFKGIAEVGASMQSLDPSVLTAVKRKNLDLDTFMEMQQELRKYGITSPLFCELIAGLPEETLETHLQANQKMLALRARVVNYNLHLLPGTEMDADESRAHYFHRTGWRMHDNAYGEYLGTRIVEGQEVVLETSTMSFDDIWSLRFFHFILELMWNRRWYYDYLMFMSKHGAAPVDLIMSIAKAIGHDDGKLGALHRSFEEDHALEKFETYEDLKRYWTADENFERLANADYGKLNFYYIFELIIDCADEFERLIADVAAEWFAANGYDQSNGDPMAMLREIILFLRETRVNLHEGIDAESRKQFVCHFPIHEWRSANYDDAFLQAVDQDKPVNYVLYLDEKQKRALKTQLSQFKSQNRRLTLRKLAEVINPSHLFYQVDAAE